MGVQVALLNDNAFIAAKKNIFACTGLLAENGTLKSVF